VITFKFLNVFFNHYFHVFIAPLQKQQPKSADIAVKPKVPDASDKALSTTAESKPLHESSAKGNNATLQLTQAAPTKRAEDLISSLFDKQREKLESAGSKAGGALGMGGSLGFGFRGTIPKLPSFKVRKNFMLEGGN